MAFTTQQNREAAIALVKRGDNTLGQTFTKPDLIAAVAAVDAWATTNAAAYNSTLPDPFKSSASAQQKALLLAYVCLQRAGVLG